jgi:hypothetical protein
VYTVPAPEQLDRWRTLGRDIFYAMNDPASMDIGALKVRIASLLVLTPPPKPPDEAD